ncbi:MAG: hypothetical protein OXG51_11280 [Gammaproteobacteria bacterium]|nr:hypothetical protein [Gammaproteobacteria bacterium]
MRVATGHGRRGLLYAAYLALACRLLVPPGYMPSALAEGGPISLCPMGLPAGFLPETAGHDHEEDFGAAERLWEPCLFGAAVDTALATARVHFDVTRLQLLALPVHAVQVHNPPRALGFFSRAPPRLVA